MENGFWKSGDVLGGAIILDSRYRIVFGPYLDERFTPLVDIEVLVTPGKHIKVGEIIREQSVYCFIKGEPSEF